MYPQGSGLAPLYAGLLAGQQYQPGMGTGGTGPGMGGPPPMLGGPGRRRACTPAAAPT